MLEVYSIFFFTKQSTVKSGKIKEKRGGL